MSNFICNTGYEFCRVSIKELTLDEINQAEEAIGMCCDKCGKPKSEKWYLEKIINNYLPDYRVLCEKCK